MPSNSLYPRPAHMPTRAVHRPRTTALQAWAWLLMFVLLLQSGAGAVAHLLGRAHTHRAVEAQPAPGWLSVVMAWRESRLQAQQTFGMFKHAAPTAGKHDHDGLERHHHGREDTSVQAVDSTPADATADSGQAGAGSVVPAWGPTAGDLAGVRVAALSAADAWHAAPEPSWLSALVRLPERPPRA